MKSDLESILELQKHNLQKMLEVLKSHQTALVHNDLKLIEDSITSEEVLLQNIMKTETEKSTIIEQLDKQYSLHLVKPSLTNLLIAVQRKEDFNYDSLQKLQFVIKKLTLEISRINLQNRVLIENAKSFIKNTISALVGQNKRQLLDKRL